MSTVASDPGTPDQGRGYEHGFQAPRRRQKALSVVTVAVLAAVGFLVYLMARGPDADALAQRLVDAARVALPQGSLSAADLHAAVAEYQRALDTSPGNAYALEATAMLQQRVAGQIDADIGQGALDRAEEILATASGSWPDSDMFSDTGELRSALDSALLEQRIREQVSESIVAAQEALAGGTTETARLQDIGAALVQLRQALDLDPGNDRAQTLREDVRRDLVAATRRELDAGNPDRAQALLDVARNEWRGDDGIAQLHAELGQLLDDLAATAELQRLLGLGEQRLAADNLTTPPGDSAVDYFRGALALDSENEQAGAGLARVAERYALLIRDAVERGDVAQSRRLMSRLTDVAPQHPDIEPLQARIEAAADAEQAQQDRQAAPVAATRQAPSQAPSQGAVMADDEEGRLWSAVMNLCDEAQLRRYIDAYPAGRYIEEAWRRRSACLEAR